MSRPREQTLPLFELVEKDSQKSVFDYTYSRCWIGKRICNDQGIIQLATLSCRSNWWKKSQYPYLVAWYVSYWSRWSKKTFDFFPIWPVGVLACRKPRASRATIGLNKLYEFLLHFSPEKVSLLIGNIASSKRMIPSSRSVSCWGVQNKTTVVTALEGKTKLSIAAHWMISTSA